MLTTMLSADAVKVNKGGPGSGPHPAIKAGLHIGARAIRNPKVKGWQDGKDSRGNDQTKNNHGVIVDHVMGHDNQDRPMASVMFRSDADAAMLKNPNKEIPGYGKPDKYDLARAEKGTIFGVKELVPEPKKK